MNHDLFGDAIAPKAPEADKAPLHNQLIKLGDMMGDGMHHEADGNWIIKEYRRVCKALGLAHPRTNNTESNNAKMARALEHTASPGCTGPLKQTRSGSLRAICPRCSKTYKFEVRKMPKIVPFRYLFNIEKELKGNANTIH